MANYATQWFQFFTWLARSALLSGTVGADNRIADYENVSTGKFGTGSLGDLSSRTGGAVCCVALHWFPDILPTAWPDEYVRSRLTVSAFRRTWLCCQPRSSCR